MSLWRTSVTWLRHTLAWSTSNESRHERIVGLTLLIAAALLTFLGWTGGTLLRLEDRTIRIPMPFWLLVSLWAVWLVALLTLLARGSLKLFGPVLFYDMVRSARRSRYFLLRGMYCAILLLILFFVWMTVSSHTALREQDLAARLAESFFEMFTITQLVAVMLLTPAYVAGAISEEKDRKTLEFLLATDLRNREIVFSKYLSRLANLMLFLLTGLPILSMLQFLGGIDPNLVMASFAFTMLTTIGLGGVSILNSVIYKRPRDSITITYLFILGYLGLTTALLQAAPPSTFLRGAPGLEWGQEGLDFLYVGNIFVLLAKIYDAGSRGALAADLPGLLTDYALFFGGLALVSIAWATVRLRNIALKQAFGKISRTLKARGRAAVTELPMLWKELHVEGSLKLNWAAIILIGLMVLATFANPFISFVEYTVSFGWSARGQHNLGEEMNVWVRIAGTGVACLTIMGVAIRAANSISAERDRQTIDSLLTTPLGSTEILSAKFLGSLCSVRLGWVWLGMIYIIALLTGGLHLFAFPLVIVAWFVFACAAAMIGLWYSMVCRSTMRATVLTVLTCVGVGIGHWLIWLCCGPILFLGGGAGGDGGVYLAKFQAGVTPPFVMGVLAFHGEELRHEFGSREIAEFIAFSLFGLFLWTLASLFLWNGLLVPKFRVLTGRDEELDNEALPRWRSTLGPAGARDLAQPHAATGAPVTIAEAIARAEGASGTSE
jgi:ABC-type transport system involved in multi-copper enzyme maturation permease subunit